MTLGGALLEAYTYDENGNRLTSDVGGVLRSYDYDDDDRLLGYDEDGDAVNDVTYAYDRDGYLTSMSDAWDTVYYEYSSRGELLSVDLPRLGTPGQ